MKKSHGLSGSLHTGCTFGREDYLNIMEQFTFNRRESLASDAKPEQTFTAPTHISCRSSFAAGAGIRLPKLVPWSEFGWMVLLQESPLSRLGEQEQFSISMANRDAFATRGFVIRLPSAVVQREDNLMLVVSDHCRVQAHRLDVGRRHDPKLVQVRTTAEGTIRSLSFAGVQSA